MLSKCANPGCSEVFRYLHEGKVFHLSPTPKVQMAAGSASSSLHERFWLCDECSKRMTVVWDGTQAKVVRLPLNDGPAKPFPPQPAFEREMNGGRLRRAASVGRDDG